MLQTSSKYTQADEQAILPHSWDVRGKYIYKKNQISTYFMLISTQKHVVNGSISSNSSSSSCYNDNNTMNQQKLIILQ